MAVAASMWTTVSLQVRLRTHASMLIALVDVCSRCVPSVSAGAELFQQRRCVASTHCRPLWMVHTRSRRAAEAAVVSAESARRCLT
eukprot:1820256-Prymnesium_polylepis.3